MKYIIYYQINDNIKLDSQKLAVDQYMKLHNGEIINEYTESVDNNRPQLNKAIRQCLVDEACLIIARLGRLSRDLCFMDNLYMRKVNFTCCDALDINTHTIGLIMDLVQHERVRSKKHTTTGLIKARGRGKKLGNSNLDQVRNKNTSAATNAASKRAKNRNAKIRKLIDEFENDAGRALSLREVAERLNNSGYTTSRNKVFTATQVMRIKDST